MKMRLWSSGLMQQVEHDAQPRGMMLDEGFG
jgi:hypothetical protein